MVNSHSHATPTIGTQPTPLQPGRDSPMMVWSSTPGGSKHPAHNASLRSYHTLDGSKPQSIHFLSRSPDSRRGGAGPMVRPWCRSGVSSGSPNPGITLCLPSFDTTLSKPTPTLAGFARPQRSVAARSREHKGPSPTTSMVVLIIPTYSTATSWTAATTPSK